MTVHTLTDLTILIKLLKAEGVTEYSNNGLSICFHSEVHPSPAVGVRPGQEAPQAEAEDAAYPEAPEEVVPERLKKLNPNYRKLIEVTRRG